YAAPDQPTSAVSPLSATGAQVAHMGNGPASGSTPATSFCWKVHVAPEPTKTYAAPSPPTTSVPLSNASEVPKPSQSELSSGSTIGAASLQTVPDRVKTCTVPNNPK